MVHALGDIFDALLIIVFGTSLVVTVAQSAHSAATNTDVSASPGASSIVGLLPFVFVAIIAFAAFDLIRGRGR